MKLRNENVSEIFDGCRTGNKTFDIMSQFHHVFVFGDMNYR